MINNTDMLIINLMLWLNILCMKLKTKNKNKKKINKKNVDTKTYLCPV